MFAEEFVRSYEQQIAEFKLQFPIGVDYPPVKQEQPEPASHAKTLSIKVPRDFDADPGEAQNDPDAADEAEQR